MDEYYEEIVQAFSKALFEGRVVYAQKLVMNSIKDKRVTREKLATAIFRLGREIQNGMKGMEELQRHTLILHCIETSVRIDPNRKGRFENLARAHNSVGFVLESVGRLKEAKASYRNALRAYPETAEAHLDLIRSESFLRADPVNIRALVQRARALRELGLFNQAIVAYQRILRICPSDANAHDYLARILWFVKWKVDDATRHFNLASKYYAAEGDNALSIFSRVFVHWSDALRMWQTGESGKAEKSYSLALRRACEVKKLSADPTLLRHSQLLEKLLRPVIHYFQIDREYLECIENEDLQALKEGITRISNRITKLEESAATFFVPEQELLEAKGECIRILMDILLYRHIEPERMGKVKQVFFKMSFLEGYEGVNALDTFRVYLWSLSPNKDLESVSKVRQRELFEKLRPAKALDGFATQRIAMKIAEALSVELSSGLTQPFIEEERKTRQVLTNKLKKISCQLQEIRVIVSGIEQEIILRKVAYGEVEIIFPIPSGVYKIHIPAGEITARDIAQIRTELSNMLAGAMEKAKEVSVRLYRGLREHKDDLIEQIIGALCKLRRP